MDITIKKIEYKDTKHFILNIHYARRMPSVMYAFGAFKGDELIGIVTFGKPASNSLCIGLAGKENSKNVIELNRLCFKKGFNKHNYASFLVSHGLKNIPKNTYVVSYSDLGGWGHIGYVYQACNFLYTGLTKRRTDMLSNGHSRHSFGDRTKRQIRTEKHRYVYLCGRKKSMIKNIKYSILQYPKGKTRTYDTDNPVSILTE